MWYWDTTGLRPKKSVLVLVLLVSIAASDVV